MEQTLHKKKPISSIFLTILVITLALTSSPCKAEDSPEQIRTNFMGFYNGTSQLFLGFNIMKSSPMMFQCLDSLKNATFEYLDLKSKIGTSGDTFKDILTITKQINNLTTYGKTCIYSISDFANYYIIFYNQFTDITDFATSFFSNLLGNVITLQRLCTNVEDAQKANNFNALWYNMGRVLNIFFTFTSVNKSNGRRLEETIDFLQL